MTIRVAVVDDQALARGGFAMLLNSQKDIEVVAGRSPVGCSSVRRP